MSKNKRMDAFARETFRVGSLQGFRHFSVELRGREELLLTVHCKSSARSPCSSSGCGSPNRSPSGSGSPSRAHSLPRGNSGASSSSGTQGLPLYLQPEPNARLVPMRESCGGPLPPASPCHREPLGRTPDDEGESSSAVFLVGGYAHYNCPYVWVRAGHSLLGSFGTDEQLDAPLLLESTHAWRERTVHAWEIVAELVGAVATPSPINPFELQPGYLEELAPVDAMLLSGE